MLALEHIKSQIVCQFSPAHIILFGSHTKVTARASSDIDLCVVAQTTEKRGLSTEMYCTVEFERPIDFVLYTPEEWELCIADKRSFAYKINREGVHLYGSTV